MGIVTRLFNDIEGIYWFPIIALLLFILMFIVMVVHTLTINKTRDRELSRMPLDTDEE
ncbi:MAG: CcoQ/FixQ family Cbb3-type cytochrome c oxidase assembly chaperone [Bacteroidales bacterium]|nr:CcoQ/FixQ family Cbb3-type cytochrome c oxidase assembly chaperone [Bacteroidales bacterium]MBK9358293.1 CcoQ/FixQ family Cbb3-type cytochrome c oxidase assembly chaperone [Bacteroidales bacterium]